MTKYLTLKYAWRLLWISFAVKAFYLEGLDGPAALEFGTSAGARGIPEQVRVLLTEGAYD